MKEVCGGGNRVGEEGYMGEDKVEIRGDISKR